MTFSDFLDKIFFYLSVPKCVACEKKLDVCDRALCKKCFADYQFNKLRNCSRCARTLDNCICSNKFLREHRIKKHIKAFRYVFTDEMSPGNNLIYSLKRDNRRDVLKFLADEMADVLQKNMKCLDNCILTNVPRKSSSIKKYGMDHAGMLAKAVAKRIGCEYKSLLKSKAKKQQKHTKGEERIKNAVAVPGRNATSLHGKHIILIDDIVTTGASMSAAAKVLYALGAKTVTAASIASAYKDEYTPFQKK